MGNSIMKVDFAREFRMVTNEKAKRGGWNPRVLRWNTWILNIEKASKKKKTWMTFWAYEVGPHKGANALERKNWKTVNLWFVVLNHHSAWVRLEMCSLKIMPASCVQSLNMCAYVRAWVFSLFYVPRGYPKNLECFQCKVTACSDKNKHI